MSKSAPIKISVGVFTLIREHPSKMYANKTINFYHETHFNKLYNAYSSFYIPALRDQ